MQDKPNTPASLKGPFNPGLGFQPSGAFMLPMCFKGTDIAGPIKTAPRGYISVLNAPHHTHENTDQPIACEGFKPVLAGVGFHFVLKNEGLHTDMIIMTRSHRKHIPAVKKTVRELLFEGEKKANPHGANTQEKNWYKPLPKDVDSFIDSGRIEENYPLHVMRSLNIPSFLAIQLPAHHEDFLDEERSYATSLRAYSAHARDVLAHLLTDHKTLWLGKHPQSEAVFEDFSSRVTDLITKAHDYNLTVSKPGVDNDKSSFLRVPKQRP